MKRFEYDLSYALFKYDRARAMRDAEMSRLAKLGMATRPNRAEHVLNRLLVWRIFQPECRSGACPNRAADGRGLDRADRQMPAGNPHRAGD